MTIERKLQNIVDSKEQIKSAIENKGVTVGNAPLSQYADKIGEIQSGGLDSHIIIGINSINQRTRVPSDVTIILSEDKKIPDGIFIPNDITTSAFLKNGITYPITLNIIGKLETIGKYSFYRRELTQDLPETLKKIEENGLSGCKIRGKLPDSVEYIEAGAMGGVVYSGLNASWLTYRYDLPESLIEIGDYAFSTRPVTLTKFPKNLKRIGNNAFGKELKNQAYDRYYFPETSYIANLEYLGENTFRYANGVKTVNLPKITTLSFSYQFNNSSIEEITLGSEGYSVTQIASSSFSSSLQVLNMYVEDISSPPTGAPWGATTAEINFLQA